MSYLEKVNIVFKDEQTRRAVRSMLHDPRHRNVALAWMNIGPEKRPGTSLYQESIIVEWELKLSKNAAIL